MEEKNSHSLQLNNSFIKELNKYKRILSDIRTNKKSKTFFEDNNRNNEFNKDKENKSVGIAKKTDKILDKNIYDKVEKLEKELEELKLSNKSNNDKISKTMEEMEKKYQEQLEREKNRYNELEKQYNDLKDKKNNLATDKGNDEILLSLITQNDANLEKINNLKKENEMLKNKNEIKQKIIEIYEADIEDILKLEQKNKIED
jgi:hypothetical protein